MKVPTAPNPAPAGSETANPAEGRAGERAPATTAPAPRAGKRASPAARMANLARLARARGYLWTAFYNLYAAAVAEGDQQAGFQLADVLTALRPTHPLPELDEAFRLALQAPWARPASLTRAIVDYLMLDPSVERLTDDAGPSTEDLATAAAHLAENELFAALLQTAVASDLRLERVLILLRHYLLSAAPSAPPAMHLAALLATQAKMVEYLWPSTVGPVEPPSADDGAPPPTGARALLNSMFRAPTAAEITAIESIATDPAVACLLRRVRDDPVRLTRHRDEIERAAVSLGTAAFDRVDEPRSSACWITEPRAPRRLPLAAQRRLRARRVEGGEILVVGCGTGRELASLSATFPQAHVTALDSSTEKLAYAACRCADLGLERIDFVAGDLLDIPPLGWTFDLIECTGMRRQLPDPDFGCEALARCSRPGSLLRLSVYSDATWRLIGALRDTSQQLGVTGALADLRRFRAELLAGRHGALPPALLQSPDFFTVSGLRDLLFTAEKVLPGTSAWLAMLAQHGFEFLCEEVNSELVRSAQAAGFPDAARWSLRDSRRFEREHPFAFGGTQYLWFERRAGATH